MESMIGLQIAVSAMLCLKRQQILKLLDWAACMSCIRIAWFHILKDSHHKLLQLGMSVQPVQLQYGLLNISKIQDLIFI
nr:hypothetical protein Iba_chr12aCG14050 [Ipomoea batatas]